MPVFFSGFLIIYPLLLLHLVFSWLALECDVIFMILVRRSFHAFPHRFIGFNNASVFCLALVNATGFPVLLTLMFARHCGWHQNFQLSTRIFHDVFEFLTTRINEGLLFIYQSLSPDHLYPSVGFSFNTVNLLKPVHISDTSRFPSTFQ